MRSPFTITVLRMGWVADLENTPITFIAPAIAPPVILEDWS
jgi:hypothetical protein